MWNWTFELHFSSVHIRPEHRASGPPPGSRPAEDRAGCHAAGGAGSDVTVKLPLLLSERHTLSFERVLSHEHLKCHSLWTLLCDSPPQTSQSVPPTVGLNSQSLWRVSLQYLDSQLYSMFLMLLSVLYIYMGNCPPVSTSSCFKLAYNTTSFVKQAQSELMVPTATQMIWTHGGLNGISFGKCALLPSYSSSDQRICTSPHRRE